MNNNVNNELETSKQAEKSENQLDEATLDTVHGGVSDAHSAPKSDREALDIQEAQRQRAEFGKVNMRTL